MREFGVGALSDGELLALILGTGFRTPQVKLDAREIAEQLLVTFGGLDAVVSTPPEILERVRGLGSVKASRLVTIAEIARRIRGGARTVAIRNADDAFNLFSDLTFLNREELWLALLDQQNRCLKKIQVCAGGSNTCSVSPREVVRLGVKYDGVRLLIAHNHPSGEARPSADDITFTRLLSQAAETVGVELVDHIVVGRGREFFSFKREGYLKEKSAYADLSASFSRERTVVPITR
ncbi:MAG: DNA repair protein RadC [Deltaproteobacteria bacterium]|nr:DNA repair protein RadC [Deltaproteobacteria bacterium]MBI3293463.1 DNA repair protein RadC [Deltaproteobacteria bacterium]